VFYFFWNMFCRNLLYPQAAQRSWLAVRRYAELQPVFAGSFRVIGSSTSAPSAEVVMTAVVAMPTALGVCAWLQVAHGNFLRVLFVHITLPFFSNVGLVSCAEYFFRFDHSRHGMIIPRANEFRGKVLTL
jgi:hypothetical protein